MGEVMMFPDTVEEFMEQYKIVDREQVYTNGTELVPIFRMKQWFAHKRGRWIPCKASIHPYGNDVKCSECDYRIGSSFGYKYCPMCGAIME